MTRVIHTGDTHIGYRQYHSAERRADFLSSFRQVASAAIDENVDALVHAGDLFHDRRPGLQDLLGTLDVLRDLTEAGVPFLAIVGNHEGTREGQWLDLFSRMGLATRLDGEGTEIGETTFYGLDHVPVSQREALDYDFAPPETEHAALVAHGLFEPFAYADWDTEALLDRAAVEFDAMLLGDNHHPDRAEVGETWVTYCGSTERASAAEREDRSYNLVDFEDGEAHISRRGLDTREFVFVDVELAEDEGANRVIERVGQHDLDGCVVIVTIDGEGGTVTPAEVESVARERGALIARVTDKREIEESDGFDVSFSDPDAAVRERLSEMGLSKAANDIDETVRASTVADSNVRETVEKRVRTLIEDDTGAFGTAADTEDSTVVETDTGEEDTDDESPASRTGSDELEAVGTAEIADRPEATTSSDDGQGQSSMEEYL